MFVFKDVIPLVNQSKTCMIVFLMNAYQDIASFKAFPDKMHPNKAIDLSAQPAVYTVRYGLLCCSTQ